MAQQRVDVIWFDELDSGDVAKVGGKNASLGEMVQHLKEAGIAVPDGFATTAELFRHYLTDNELDDFIGAQLQKLDDGASLREVGRRIRRAIVDGQFDDDSRRSILDAYDELNSRYERDGVDVAVRSSATAEDLPEASFAGQQETYLNVHGHRPLLDACRRCFASLFTDRAISYRQQQGFDHLDIALSVGVQKMVRSDIGGSGVAFTIDTDTGFPDTVVINAAWGLGETVVQGSVDPDEYTVFKPLLDGDVQPIVGKKRGDKARKMIYAGGSQATEIVDTDAEQRARFVLDDHQITRLARWCRDIEDHYGRPMDIEWAVDGETDELFIVQARPETVQSQKVGGILRNYRLKERGQILVEGTSIGSSIAAAPACKLDSPDDSDDFVDGAILITEVTHPDWVPVMERAGGIVTELGGRTSHAAIVSRELGVPAVVGASGARARIDDGQDITLSCAEGDRGVIYRDRLDYEIDEVDVDALPTTDTRIMMNIASPQAAFRWWRLPFDGIGLARMEFIIENIIEVHPMALVDFDGVQRSEDRRAIEERTAGYSDRRQYFVDHLSRGIAKIAAAGWPDPVICRTSDFKTNEYADLIGGASFEPSEDNPMLGLRGASRYYSDLYREAFALECRALRRVRDEMGLTNVVVMIPFCRTCREADRVLEIMADNGLERGANDLEVYVMCEIPSNVVLADQFARRFDGFSIGSNDLTQLALGVDRDSALLADLFDERDDTVKRMIRQVIETAHAHDTPVGICGQAPSDYPEFAAFLVDAGIDSISINPDSVADVRRIVAERESGND